VHNYLQDPMLRASRTRVLALAVALSLGAGIAAAAYHLSRIAPIGKEVNNVTTFEVRVSIANPEGRLRVNMSANAEIVLEEHKHVLIIPEAALVYDRGTNTSVQLRDEHAPVGFRKVAVRTGISNGQRTEVLEGVAETDHVVLP